LKDISKFIHGKNCLMDQCKIIDTCKCGYCNICHINGIRLISTKFWSVIAIPSFVSWFKILSQYGVGIIFLVNFHKATQYPSKFHGECKYPKMMQVLHLNYITLCKWHSTINVKNFAIPSFIWINMSGMI